MAFLSCGVYLQPFGYTLTDSQELVEQVWSDRMSCCYFLVSSFSIYFEKTLELMNAVALSSLN